MEPVTIAAIVGYLARTLGQNKAFKDFTADFTEASVNWIRPIFLKSDNSPKDVLERLQDNPESEGRKKAAEAAIASHLEDDPSASKLLEEMYSVIKGKGLNQQANISNSKNVNTGTISAGGSVFFGDVKK